MSKAKKEEEPKADAEGEEKKKEGAAEGGEGGEKPEGEGGEGEGGGFNAKKILMIVVPLFVLLGILAGVYFSGVADPLLIKAGIKKDPAVVAAEAAKEAAEKPSAASFLQIPDILVNLNSPDGQSRYLRLSIQLELANEEDKKAVEAVMPRVVDQFQTYLRELRVKDLRGSAGIYRLQMELLNRVNTAAYPVEVKDVLFQEILIQ